MGHLRDTYFPGTEELGPDEMRLTALGTGTPQLRPSQAAASWFLELGNGDKFFFDMGAGSMMNFAALGQSFVKANKLFLSHLHIDHMCDFISWYVGGWVERLGDGGVEVWGPSGTEPELGTKYCVNSLIDACKWDIISRRGTFPEEGLAIDIHEFDYTALNEVVYDRNGVVIRSWPAVHLLDGPVSFSLEWNGMKFVYGGDTFPNKWFLEYAKDADVAIHECFITVDDLQSKVGFPREFAITVGTQIHTSPSAFASVMNASEPRMAIAYHFFNDAGTAPGIYKEILNIYDGPVTLAKDLMVWNITPESITTRQLVNTADTWPQPEENRKPGTRGKATPMSDWLSAGRVAFPGVDEFPDEA